MQKLYLYLALAAIIAVIAFLLFYTGTGKGTPGAQLVPFDDKPVDPAVLAQLRIPDSVASKVGVGFASNFPKSVSGKPLTLNGKPEVLYIGSEFCPYCALIRWSLVIALMRFGNFTGLEYMTSSATDVGPNTPTFTFVNAQYTSSYVSFVSRELVDNKINASTNTYTPLQSLNLTQTSVQQKYDPRGSIPFVDYANMSIQNGANYNDPTVLANRNWSTIANLLQNSSSLQAQAMIGGANVATAQICKLTNNTPASVCGQAYIKSIESQLS